MRDNKTNTKQGTNGKANRLEEPIASTSTSIQDSNASRLERFKQIQLKQREANLSNRNLLKSEQNTVRNAAKQARQQDRADKLQAALDLKRSTRETGEQEERVKAWEYSIEDNENWKKKQADQAKISDSRFHNDDTTAERIYERNARELKPVTRVNEKAEDELTYGSHRPSEQSLDNLTSHLNKQAARKQNFSRKRKEAEGGDVTYINKANAHFNKKLSRFFDKYTKETKAALERGTA